MDGKEKIVSRYFYFSVNIYTGKISSYTEVGKPSEQRFDKLNPPWFPGKKERFFSDNINSWDSDVPLALRAFPFLKFRSKKRPASDIYREAALYFHNNPLSFASKCEIHSQQKSRLPHVTNGSSNICRYAVSHSFRNVSNRHSSYGCRSINASTSSLHFLQTSETSSIISTSDSKQSKRTS